MRTASHLILVGMMGAGKSTVGRHLAERTGAAFVDLDEAIEAVAGRSVADLFATEGEPGFRMLETDVLLSVLDREGATVVATGGGAVLSMANRLQMRAAGPVIWLRAEVPTLVRRVGEDPSRPLLGDDATASLVALGAEREGAYRSAAHHVVDVDARSVEDVADWILERVGADWGGGTGRPGPPAG